MNSDSQKRWFDDVEKDPVHMAAAEWLTRLQDSQLSFEDSLEWQRWMNSDPKHAEAFARVEEVWQEPWDMMRKVSHKPRQSRVSVWAVAATLGAVAVTGVWLVHTRDTVIRTAVGENRTITLNDGSMVILGGSSEVSTRYSEASRRLTLRKGEAFFTVAKDAKRPFVVRAGTATVTAVGTAFNIRRGSSRVFVAVVEGRVAVDSAGATGSPAGLSAGEATIIDNDKVHAKTQLPDLSAATGWQYGQLAFRQEPLRYVLEDVNRYAVVPIILGDPSIGDIQITGTVISSSIPSWITGLENAFGLTAVRSKTSIVLERPASRTHTK